MRDWGGGGIVTHRAPVIHGYWLRMKPPSALADSHGVARNRLETRHCLGREHACSVGRLDPRMADAEWVTNPPPPTDGCRVREPIEHPIFADVRGGIGRGRMIRPRRRRPTSPNWSSSRTSSLTRRQLAFGRFPLAPATEGGWVTNPPQHGGGPTPVQPAVGQPCPPELDLS